MLPSTTFEPLVDGGLRFAIVLAVALAATWLARLRFAPHRIPEFSDLTAEQVERRKATYVVVRIISGLAVLTAFSLLLQTC